MSKPCPRIKRPVNVGLMAGEADLSLEDRALMAFAGKVTLHAYAVTQADIDALKGTG